MSRLMLPQQQSAKLSGTNADVGADTMIGATECWGGYDAVEWCTCVVNSNAHYLIMVH